MSDLENELREVLKAKADRLPPQRSVPRRMIRRARRRVAVSALSGMVVAAALVVGGVSGLRALSGSTVQVGHTPTPSVATLPGPTPSATAPQPTAPTCPAGDLTPSVTLPDREAGTGSLVLTNTGIASCTLSGRPDVTLVDGADHPYPTVTNGISPWWRANASPQPAGWPVVALAPGGTAQVRISVTNWCATGSAFARLTFQGSGPLSAVELPDRINEKCANPSKPATASVGPVESTS
jgi:Protein of unknown function (DUF4232)